MIVGYLDDPDLGYTRSINPAALWARQAFSFGYKN
jgi:hypothetical protein